MERRMGNSTRNPRKEHQMSTDELITRAQHAIQTGQPQLAQLYMRKAINTIQEGE